MTPFTCRSDSSSGNGEDDATVEEAIRQARADLGNHRVQDLPLAGRVVHLNRDQQRKLLQGPNLRNVQPAIASWHTACREETTEPLIRSDGVGSGGLHRLGPNYRPEGVKRSQSFNTRGNLFAKRPKSSLRARSFIASDRSRSTVTQCKDELDPNVSLCPKSAKDMQFDETKMQDRNWIAAYPNAQERRAAITATMNLSASHGAPEKSTTKPALSVPLPKRSLVPSPSKRLSMPSKKTTEVSSARPAPSLNSAARGPMVKVQSTNSRRARPGYNASSLSDQPFWTAPSVAPQSRAATAIESLSNPSITSLKRDQSLKQDLLSTLNAGIKVSSACCDHVKQSSKGYLQECREDLPSHYKKVVFPRRECKTPEVGSEESDSEYSSDVYSDQEIQPDPSRKPSSRTDLQSIKSSIFTHAVHTPGLNSPKHDDHNAKIRSAPTRYRESTVSSYQHIIDALELPGITIIDHC